MEEYITAEELSYRIKEKKQTVYNRVYKGDFTLGVHYVKPTSRKLLFKWSAIVLWLEGDTKHIDASTPAASGFNHQRHTNRISSNINI